MYYISMEEKYRMVLEMDTKMRDFFRLAASRVESVQTLSAWARVRLLKSAERQLGMSFTQYKEMNHVRSKKR